jgi:outer membrane lipoprotein-sorting protein
MSRATRFLSLLSAAPAIVLMASCALPVVKPTTPPAPYVDAPEAVAALTDARTAINDIRGTVTLKTYDDTQAPTSSVTGYMAFRYPDKVRFTYIGPLGIVLFEALINDKTMVLFLPQQLTAYKGTTDTAPDGPFSPQLMAMPFRRPVGPIFVIEHTGPESTLYSISEEAGENELVEKIIFDRSTMQPLVREGYEDGLLIYRIRYLTYEDVDGISIPVDIALEDLASGSSMGITLRDFKVNTGITDEVFDTTVEPPYAVKPLDSFVLPDY